MNLAVFDLDCTLVNFDCDIDWIHFLVTKGIVPHDDIIPKLEYFFQEYHNGTLNYPEFIHTTLALLKRTTLSELEKLREEWANTAINRITEEARELVNHHIKDEQTITILATASNSFVAKPIAKEFNIQNLIATIPERLNCGTFTGKYIDKPSFSTGKIERVEAWLMSQGLHKNNFKHIYCYSDSRNDLPLLSYATHPTAVNPDNVLRQHALENNWKIIDIFE